MDLDHGWACFSTRRQHAPSAYATGVAVIRRYAAVQIDIGITGFVLVVRPYAAPLVHL